MTNSTKDFSSLQESMIADDLGWQVVAGSGAAPCVPGDVIADDWLGECKTHTSPNHKIFFDFNVWEKIEREAMAKHRAPVLFTDDGSQDLKYTWVLCYYHAIENAFLLNTDFNFAVRKNVTFVGGAAKTYLDVVQRNNAGGLFTTVVFRHQWGKYDIAVMPFNTFKELIKA